MLKTLENFMEENEYATILLIKKYTAFICRDKGHSLHNIIISSLEVMLEVMSFLTKFSLEG